MLFCVRSKWIFHVMEWTLVAGNGRNRAEVKIWNLVGKNVALDRNEPQNEETSDINYLTPNDPYMGRTAPLTSKRCILYIYSTNTCTEYFKHALYSPFYLFKMQFVS